MAELQLKIDPSGAVGPARAVKRELDQMAGSAEGAEKSLLGLANASAGLKFDSQGRLRNSMGQYATAAERARLETQRLGSVANDNFRRLATTAGVATKAIDGVQAAALKLGVALGGIAIAQQAGSTFIKLSDDATRLDGRLRLVTKSSEELARVSKDLFDISQRTRSEFAGNVELYTRSSQALREMGASGTQILTLTESLNQAFVISGATTAEQSAAIVQLSQAFASGVLRGEEFNSVSEQGPRIMQALADALGKTRGELRKLAEDGQLTSDVVFRALLSQAPKIASEFEKIPRTVSQAMVQLRNDLLMAVDGVNRSEEATTKMVSEVDRLRVVISSPEFSDGIAAIFREVAASVTQINQLVLDLGRLYTTISGAFNSASDAVTAFVNRIAQSQTAASDFSAGWFAAMADLRSYIADSMLDAVERITAIPSAGVAAYQTFVGAWSELPAALGGIIAEAAARTIEGVEGMVDGAISILNHIPGVEIEGVAGAISGRFRDAVVPGGAAAGKDFVAEFWRNFDASQGAVRERTAEFGRTIEKEWSRQSPENQKLLEGYNTVVTWAGKAAGSVREFFTGTGSAASAATGPTVKLADAVDKAGEKAAKSFEKQRRAIDESAESIQRQIDTYGQSEGAVAALEFRVREEARAWEIARAAKMDAIPQETIDAIEKASSSIETLTNRLTRMNLSRGQDEAMQKLRDEASVLYLNDDARRVVLAGLEAEADLRREGVSLNDEWGRTYVENARGMASFENSLDKQQTAFEGLRDAASDFFSSLSSGEGVLQSFVDAFAQLGNKLAAQGFEKLFGGLFAASQTASPNAGQVTSGVGQVLRQAAPIYTAPVGRVERASLPPLVTGEGFSASKAATVASQSVPARVWNFFAGKGLAPHQIAGILGNAKAESSFNPTAVGDNGQAFGLFQHNDRKNSLFNFIGGRQNLSDVNAQQEFVWKELNTTEGKAYKRLLAAKDYFEANEAMISFERPSGYQNGVKNAHNYSGRLAYTKDAYETYAGGNVASSTNNTQRTIEKATAAGVKRGIESTAYDRGDYDPGTSRTTTGGLFGERGMAGFNVLGAGIGAFSNGYSSGSPLSGGIGGIFTGLGASQSIATAFPSLAGIAGPLGAVGGAALGILGGILGARAQRKEAHKQAAAKWEEMRPQYEAFDKSLSGDGNGQLRQWITEQEGQFAQFRKVGGDAWKYGSGNSTEQFASTGTKMWTRFMEMQAEFREGFTDMVEDLSSGEGLGGAFAKGRAATKDLKKQIKDMVDDVSIAFGSSDIGVGVSAEWEAASKTMEEQRNKAIAEAKTAAGEYALSLLYTAQTSSEVEKSLDGFRGTAAGLQKILTDLGWTAEKAAADIDERLTQAIAKMAETFVDGFQRQINDLSDRGYLNDVTDLLKARDEALSDAALLGVDPSIVSKWFDLAAQDIVDGAELTGDAFDDLIKAFPALADVVKAFVDETAAVGMTIEEIGEALNRASVSRYETAVRERADAEAALRTEYERTVDRIAGIKDFLSDMALDDNLSTLDGKGQFDEAQRLYRETLFKANGGDQEAQDKLLGVTQDYLDEAKAYYATSEKYGEVYREIEATLKASATRMETELDVARRQASFLEEIAGGTKGLSALLEKYLEADRAVGGSLGDLDQNRQWGIRPVANRKNVSEFRAAGLPEYTGNFGPDTWPQIEAWLNTLSLAQRAQAMQIMTANNAIGYASGGYTGAGGMFEPAGMVHRGEVVWSQDDVRAWGGPARVDAMRVARMPEMPMMQSARNDNRDLVAALGRVESLMRTQVSTTGSGLQRVAVAAEEGSRNSRQAELAARRAANNKQAA